MATPLSDEIRALIAYANETTEAGDTKLGDCVKTLCEGYNGGKNLPSSPLVVPQGAISSRLAALLAYANETTGAGDTTMGDAIRTLCEGYGGGELVFYEKLIGDGVAYINTGAPYVEGYTYAARLCIPQTTNSWVMGAWTGNKGVTVTRNGNYVRLRLNTADTNAVSIGSDVVGYHDIDFVFTTQSNISYTLDNTTVNTGRMASNGGSNVFLFGYSSGAAVGTYARNPSSFQSYTVKNESLNEVMHLVPCTYNGEAGMWDLVSQTFFGNAASSGQFTVEGEIVFYDRLKNDGTAYIDTGVVANGVLSSMVSFRWMGSGNSPDTVILGARKDSGNTRYFLSALYSVTLAFGAGAYTQITEKIGESMSSHYLVSQFTTISSGNSKSYFTVQESGYNSVVNTSSQTVTDTNKSLYLFRNNYSTPSSCNRYMSIHEVKIWDDDTMTNLILHLVPCTLGGVAGMWDKVSWKFFGNSNTSGAFTAENDS